VNFGRFRSLLRVAFSRSGIQLLYSGGHHTYIKRHEQSSALQCCFLFTLLPFQDMYILRG